MTDRSRRGFSLIETLVAIAVAGVGFMAILQVYPRAFAASAKSQSRAIATSTATDIISSFRRELLNNNRAYVRKKRTGATWSSDFSAVGVTGPTNYFYQVWVEDMRDPFEKYLVMPPLGTDQPYKGTNLAGTTAYDYKTRQLWRLSVFVRGPFTSLTEAANWGGVSKSFRTSQVQVSMSTLVADRELGSTVLLRDAEPGHTKIYVSTLDHFTCFNAANLGTSWTSVEVQDAGPMRGADLGCNYLTLDNIWIGDTQDVNAAINNPGTIAGTGESNKVIDMGYNADLIGSSPAGLYLQLLHPIRGKWDATSGAWVAYKGYMTNPTTADLVNSMVAVQKPQ